MKRYSPLQEINLAAKLADLRDADYHNTLLLDALIELLIEKNVLSHEELHAKARHLDQQTVVDGRVLPSSHPQSDSTKRPNRPPEDSVSPTPPPFS
ncbi:hypothetical protein LOK74_20650 [Brevibacillus humidisoli]|uniref:hypothetical protein n=1 Tax=Brevibacillus humidisoli TaxID=2895522 RepID=UPI001E32418A|nr:hypothetical protein [Brevibacillus humidisoli]UFJ40414.1 hypothetical protein LOK74_20650 [Brevibacillus humidisoli]